MGNTGCGCGATAKCAPAPKAERKPGNSPVSEIMAEGDAHASGCDAGEPAQAAEPSCGCSAAPKYAADGLQGIGTLPTRISWRDVLGGWGVRWGIRRMSYGVPPGLYRIGAPGPDSPVLVTANYKLTVDSVRRSVAGLGVWLLVLDTKAVNVWCAAGKGTFGTEELVRRIRATKLAEVVKHRKLVLPQLSATGVAAHIVKRETGFGVHYGPVRAADIPAYLAAGMKASPEMRRVRFGWKDRLAVAPVDFVGTFKPALGVLAALVVLDLIRHRQLTAHLSIDFLPFAAAVLTGSFLVPLLLPWLPFRAFVLKGAVAGAAVVAALLLTVPMGIAEGTGTGLLMLAITSYLAMMFTGSSTFTTLAGARLEVRRGIPVILGAAGTGAVLRVIAAFL